MNPMDDPWRQEEQRLKEQQQPKPAKQAPNLMGCKLGAAGCFGLLVTFCLIAGAVQQGTQAVLHRLNQVEDKIDRIDKKLEAKKPDEMKPDAEKLDVLPKRDGN